MLPSHPVLLPVAQRHIIVPNAAPVGTLKSIPTVHVATSYDVLLPRTTLSSAPVEPAAAGNVVGALRLFVTKRLSMRIASLKSFDPMYSSVSPAAAILELVVDSRLLPFRVIVSEVPLTVQTIESFAYVAGENVVDVRTVTVPPDDT